MDFPGRPTRGGPFRDRLCRNKVSFVFLRPAGCDPAAGSPLPYSLLLPYFAPGRLTCDFHQPAHQPKASVNLDVDVDDLFGWSLLMVSSFGPRVRRAATTRQSRP